MKVIRPGHEFQLNHLDGINTQTLNFVNRNTGNEREGTTNQEVLRALISRVIFLDHQLPWFGNAEILHHLEMALVLHEARALIRKVEKKNLDVMTLDTGEDGHFVLRRRD